mgnify:CR=1 FL=1|jgi:D-alanine-D-alanine ligase
MSKITVGVIFGGKSGEHEVSLNSAANVMEAMDTSRYDIVKLGITKEGQWKRYCGQIENIRQNTWQEDKENIEEGFHVFDQSGIAAEIDIYFPVLHGPNGEDGTIQGFFEIAGKPYVGCGVFASAVGMEKTAAKELFRQAGIPIVDYIAFYINEWQQDQEAIIKSAEAELGYPMFIKPVNMGSSVGISKIKDRADFIPAVEKAFKHDIKLLIEKMVDGREIECAVCGNFDAVGSTPGEVIPSREFYDYDSKYNDGDKSRVIIPAELDSKTAEKVKDYAVRAFKAIDGSGLSRVDFFLEKNSGKIYINEINTMPGFTQISMYPKMMQHDGLTYAALIDRLIELGFERYEIRKTRQ